MTAPILIRRGTIFIDGKPAGAIESGRIEIKSPPLGCAAPVLVSVSGVSEESNRLFRGVLLNQWEELYARAMLSRVLAAKANRKRKIQFLARALGITMRVSRSIITGRVTSTGTAP